MADELYHMYTKNEKRHSNRCLLSEAASTAVKLLTMQTKINYADKPRLDYQPLFRIEPTTNLNITQCFKHV